MTWEARCRRDVGSRYEPAYVGRSTSFGVVRFILTGRCLKIGLLFPSGLNQFLWDFASPDGMMAERRRMMMELTRGLRDVAICRRGRGPE